MRSIILSGVVVALLAFSGCSSKGPAVDDQAANNSGSAASAQEVNSVNTETVNADNSLVNSSENSLKEIESKLPTIQFAFDKYTISSDMQEKIDSAAELSKKITTDYSLKLEGNCDEWGSDEYNFALGLKRANAVKKALVADGIDASKISMISYGESNPVCTDHTKECWAKNRRVDFKLLP